VEEEKVQQKEEKIPPVKAKTKGKKNKNTPAKTMGMMRLFRALMNPLSRAEIGILLGGLSQRGVYRYLRNMAEAGFRVFGFDQPRLVKNEETGEKTKYSYSLLPESFAGKMIDYIFISRPEEGNEDGMPQLTLRFSLRDKASGERTVERVACDAFSIMLFTDPPLGDEKEGSEAEKDGEK